MKELHWTWHARAKMRQHMLSESRVKRVTRHPKRVEKGIAPDTIAVMQPAGSKNNPYEIWVMVSEKNSKRNIISAWRYPGKTKPGEPLPEEILKEFREAL